MSPNGHLDWYPALLHVTRGELSDWSLYPPHDWCTNASTEAALRDVQTHFSTCLITSQPCFHAPMPRKGGGGICCPCLSKSSGQFSCLREISRHSYAGVGVHLDSLAGSEDELCNGTFSELLQDDELRLLN